MKKIIIILILLIIIPTQLFAEAYFAAKKEMVERAEAIAIIEILNTEKVEKKGQHWAYRQKVIGTVEKTLKGNIPADIIIYGMETFICAQCRFEKGRFLLFLQRENDFWIGSNWHLGIRQINDGKTDWFMDDTSPFKMQQQPLKEVILDIQNTLKEK